MFNLLRLITHCNVNGNYREEANRGWGFQRPGSACRVLYLILCEVRLLKMHAMIQYRINSFFFFCILKSTIILDPILCVCVCVCECVFF